MEIETKKFVIEVKANDQGRFVKILEVRRGGSCPSHGCVGQDYMLSVSVSMWNFNQPCEVHS